MSVSAIYVAPHRGAPMQDIKSRSPDVPWAPWKNTVDVMLDGILGDYHTDVTFFDERLRPAGENLPWQLKHLRRNVILDGVDLPQLIIAKQYFRIGTVTFQATRLLTACDRPTKLREQHEEAPPALVPVEANFSRAWDGGMAGIAARVIIAGQMEVGDQVYVGTESVNVA